MEIEDGLGKGFVAGVTINHRLMTSSISLTLTEAATASGDTYNLNSSETTLTTTGESALFYIKNEEPTNLILTGIVINIMDYVGTGGQPILKIYRNPSLGTIISDGFDCNEQNRNYGSKKTINMDCFQGSEGKTLTGQDNIVPVYLPTTDAVTLITFDTVVVLPRGASLGISWTPPSGMTSTKIVVSINVTLNGTQL